MWLPRNEQGTYWTVREKSRSLSSNGNRNHHQDKQRSFPAVKHGWRLSRDAERATITMAVTEPRHRSLLQFNPRVHWWTFPRFTYLDAIDWIEVEVSNCENDEMRDYCFANDIAVLSRRVFRKEPSFATVERDRAVEFRLRFG